MKRIITFVLCLTMLIYATTALGDSEVLASGEYSATAMGFGGLITVTVRVGENGVCGVAIEGADETPGVGGKAIKEISAALSEDPNGQIDIVSGATFTSEAVKKAFSQAVGMIAGNAAVSAAPAFVPGTYEVTEVGVEPITIAFTFDKSSLVSIDILEQNESFNTGTFALEKLSADSIGYQTANVDMVTGATATAAAFKRALTKAVEQAGGDISQFYSGVDDTVEYHDESVDAVVVGTGWAGMCAAQTAHEKGLNVIVLEQNAMIGGVSMGTNHVYGYDTIAQKENGITVTESALKASMQWLADLLVDLYKNINGVNMLDQKGLDIMAHDSHDLIDWLLNLGVDIKYDVPGDVGAHANTDRVNFSTGGEAMVSRMKEIFSDEGIDLRLENKAVEILMDGDRAAGVKVKTADGQTYSIHANAVILCTGSYFSNTEMVDEYFVHFPSMPTDNRSGSDGSGIMMAKSAGADIENLDMGTPFPFALDRNGVYYDVFAKPYIIAGGIVVNEDGERFVNELADYLTASLAVLKQPGSHSYIMLDETARKLADAEYPGHIPYISDHYLKRFETLDDMAKAYGFNAETLKETIKRYGELYVKGEDSDFGKPAPTMTTSLENGPYYIVDTKPVLHTLWGGIKIDYDGHALRADGSEVVGLYAAGECSNLFGMGTDPATEACIYGRRAAIAASVDFAE